MKFALFRGCKIPYYANHYETSLRLVLDKFGLELAEVEFNCCGYPVRQLDFKAWLLSAGRNLALTAQAGLPILTPCMCCYGSLKKAQHLLAGNEDLRGQIAALLWQESLTLPTEEVEIKHYLTVLDEQVGAAKIKENITAAFSDLKVAVHYGCHALRPSAVTQFDDPHAPTVFDRLVEATGAKSVEWARKMDCCGNPVADKNPELAMDLTLAKAADAAQAGADFLCVGCTYCHIQLDGGQAQAAKLRQSRTLPSLLYPQLLGVALGLDPAELGLGEHQIDASALPDFVSTAEEK